MQNATLNLKYWETIWTHLKKLSWICRGCRGRRRQSCPRCSRRWTPAWPAGLCTVSGGNFELCCTRPPRQGSRCWCARAGSPPAGSCSSSTSPLCHRGLLEASHTAPRQDRRLASKRPPLADVLDLQGASGPVCLVGWTRNQSRARWGLELFIQLLSVIAICRLMIDLNAVFGIMIRMTQLGTNCCWNSTKANQSSSQWGVCRGAGRGKNAKKTGVKKS